jgi:hypothetical protein
MECKYNHDDICTNEECPVYSYSCPIPDDDGICRYEDRVDEVYVLSPKSCLLMALLDSGVTLNNRIFDDIWNNFADLMKKHGYVEEE